MVEDLAVPDELVRIGVELQLAPGAIADVREMAQGRAQWCAWSTLGSSIQPAFGTLVAAERARIIQFGLKFRY